MTTQQLLCTNCAHSMKANQTLLCSHDANPVTGEPRHFCNTQRLVGTKDEAKAIQAAELIGFCGPNARFFMIREVGHFGFFKNKVRPNALPSAMAVPNT